MSLRISLPLKLIFSNEKRFFLALSLSFLKAISNSLREKITNNKTVQGRIAKKQRKCSLHYHFIIIFLSHHYFLCLYTFIQPSIRIKPSFCRLLTSWIFWVKLKSMIKSFAHIIFTQHYIILFIIIKFLI